MYTPVNHSFTIKVGLKGSKLYYHVFVMGESRQHYITDIKIIRSQCKYVSLTQPYSSYKMFIQSSNAWTYSVGPEQTILCYLIRVFWYFVCSHANYIAVIWSIPGSRNSNFGSSMCSLFPRTTHVLAHLVCLFLFFFFFQDAATVSFAFITDVWGFYLLVHCQVWRSQEKINKNNNDDDDNNSNAVIET